MPKSILAVLAGASVFAPPDQVGAEPIFDDALFDPGGEQQPMLIRAQSGSVAMTIYGDEDLSRRGDVGVYETEYQFNLVVPVPYSADGWRPAGGFQGRSDLDATMLHAYVPDTLNGIWTPGSSCLVREDMNNINWTTTASSVTLSFHVDRARFDAARAANSGAIVIRGWLEPSSACPRSTTSAPPSTSSSDDDK